jgi:hypothetical protein
VLSAAVLLIVVFTTADLSVAAETSVNPIVRENQQLGTNQWKIGNGIYRTSDDVNQQIEGYASNSSVDEGQAISFFVTVNPPQTYTIDVYRLGWYGGRGGRFFEHIGPLRGQQQPDCPIDSDTGLRACSWQPSYTLTVRSDWTTGIYLARLTNARRYQSYIVFTVRDDRRNAAVLYQQPVNTYQAYNNWPNDQHSGKSLYGYNSYGPPTIGGDPRAVKVSFDRPYSAGGGAGDLFQWEVYLVDWLERSGYDVSYSTDLDTHAGASRLLNFKAFLSAGHDEYWTEPMYDAVQSARDRGVNLGFMGANALYWQVRLEAAADGTPDRVLVCYKDPGLDPIADPSLKTINWRVVPVNRPEQELVGVQSAAQLPNNDNAEYVVADSTNWAYANTGVRDGTSISGLVGYEFDRRFADYPLPAYQPGTYALLSQSPVVNTAGESDSSNASIYRARSGAWVFASGTMSWSWALDKPGYVNPSIQQMTSNVLNRFIATST